MPASGLPFCDILLSNGCFLRVIESVHHKLEQFSRREKSMDWYMKYPDDEDTLQGARWDVRHAMVLFSVCLYLYIVPDLSG